MTIYNFSAGPATLPKPVLEKAQAELLNYQDSGMSVLEMSHRSPEFDKIVKDAEATLRELMAIPDNYKVIFLQGGGSTQFSMLPLNLAQGKKAYYLVGGSWGKKLIQKLLNFQKPFLLNQFFWRHLRILFTIIFQVLILQRLIQKPLMFT